MALAAVMPVTLTVANAGEGSYSGGGSYSGLAQREMLRRQDNVQKADQLLIEGREAYAKEKYKEAVDKYKEALGLIPDAPMTADRRKVLIEHLSMASTALADTYRRHGDYEAARTLANDVLAQNPNDPEAKRVNEWLDDPIRTNPAATPEHTANVDKVRRSLYLAEGAYNLGKYDDAFRHYEDVIRLDPYNKAARRGMERVAQARADYYRAAYDHTRAQLLAEVDKAWELAVPPVLTEPIGPRDDANRNSTGIQYIQEKLRTIVIPIIDFEDTSVEEAVDFLRLRSRELDVRETDPTKKGINFVIRKPRSGGGPADAGVPADAGASLGGAASDPGAIRIKELRLRNVPLNEALKYICDLTKLRPKVDEFAVTLVPATETDEDLFTRTFDVPPNFIQLVGGAAGEGGGGGGAEPDPFGGGGGGEGGTALRPRRPITEILKEKGISEAAGSSATLTGSKLVVRNTPTNIDLIEQLVDSVIGEQPKQVKISTKFVEITQENTDELGFDWIVSPFGLSANQVFASGGTVGSGQSRTNTDFIGEVAGVTIPGIPADPSTDVTNIVTAGNRTGLGAINRNSIDAILNNTDRSDQSASPAPGIAALTGLFSDGQVQMIMRGLAQKKGTDLMTAPSITARSGEKALIEIIREFIYPTEYEPPELPNSIGSSFTGGGGGLGGLGGGGASSFPVTPATPTSFETRNTGLTLEIEPTIGGNDFVIDLRFAPEIVEFEGFVNYGSPIQSPATDFLGNPTTVTITENRIEMPVFSTRRVTTALTIYDGYTVAVGGLMREDVQTVEDSVPIFGDIPIVGRLFQSRAENRIKSNLIIFVTAQIIDATGRPLRGPEAMPQAPETATPDMIPASTDGVLPLPPP